MATKSVGTLSAKLLLDTKGWTAGFGSAQKTATSATATMSSAITRAATSYGAMATGAISAALSVNSLAKSFTDIDRQAKLADRLGLDVGEVKKLSLAADLAGTDVEVLAKAMLKMGKEIGSGGVPLDKRMFQVAEALSKITDAAERGKRSEEVFGKGGMELLNFLMQGGQGIRNSADAIDRFGLAISRVDAAKVEAANDSWTEMKTVLGGIRDLIAVELAPTVNTFIQDWLLGTEALIKGTDSWGASLSGVMDWFDSFRAFWVNPPWMATFDDYLGTIKALQDQRADARKNRAQGAMKPSGELPFKFLDKDKDKKAEKAHGGKTETQEAVERGSLAAAIKVAELGGNPIYTLNDIAAKQLEQLKAINTNVKGQKKIAQAKL